MVKFKFLAAPSLCLSASCRFHCNFGQNITVMNILDLYRRDDKQLAAYRAACTLKTCPIKESYYAYRPSLPANAVFLALFSFSLCCFILQAALSRRFIGFTAAMFSGCSLEVLGYIGRIMSWYNPFNQVCLFPLTYHCPRDLLSVLMPPTERFPNADRLPHHRPSVPSSRNLPHSLPHRHYLRP